MERIILHCDMNNFYASVEMALNKSLCGKAIAVCGSEKDRQGIVLAKSEIAKKAGVQTGDVIWQARKKCPDLIVVPPSFDEYQKYSILAKEIYYKYTNLIEPFGLDECWLDVTQSVRLFGSGVEIANKIRQDIKENLGVTVSIGVSFNKIFAKLGSDMKKPDAVTEITKANFKEQIFHLNANEIIGIGKASYEKLIKYNIKTIGDLARADETLLKKILGKNGIELFHYANGRDFSKVLEYDSINEPKSLSNGITCTKDLVTNYEVYRVMLKLSQDIAKRQRKLGLYATKVQISIKDTKLITKQWQTSFDTATCSFNEITNIAFKLFTTKYNIKNPVRAVSVSVFGFTKEPSTVQIDLFSDTSKSDKILKLEQTMDILRQKYGKNIIEIASLTEDIKIIKDKTEVKVLPSNMNK